MADQRSGYSTTSKTTRIVWGAMFAAIICVATLAIRIPSPLGGYLNLGDTTVLLAAFMLGPWLGAAAAGIGSMLADIISGYALYALPTLLIKSLMAFTAALIYHALKGNRQTKKSTVRSAFVAGIVAEIIMVTGYYLFALLFLSHEGSAVLTIPGNAIQGAVGIAGGLALLLALPNKLV